MIVRLLRAILLLATIAVPNVVRAERLPDANLVLAFFQEADSVWVNSSSRVYHCPGTRYFGATKRGFFTTESEARSSGNRPAYGKACRATAEPLGLVTKGRSPAKSVDVKVWVNSSSHVYHCPGTRYYANTKRGEFMSESRARAEGNRAAANRTCS